MTYRGTYFGTEVNDAWWRRYLARGFFARGLGELSLDEEGIHFKKAITNTSLSIAWGEATGAELSRWHCGRWGLGRPILKVHFLREDKPLVAGFVLSPDWDEMQAFTDDLQQRIEAR